MSKLLSTEAVFRVFAAVTLLAGTVSMAVDGPRTKRSTETRTRRPVALLTSGKHLLVGNRTSGTITVIDRARRSIVCEHRVAERIADMARLDERRVLVLDDAAGELRAVSPRPGDWSVQSIAAIPGSATKLAVARERHQVFISARWAREVVSITFDGEFEHATRRESIELPFAPHELLLVDGDRSLLVADAFSGRVAVVDAVERRTPRVHTLRGHNIRGLAVSANGERLYVAHQRMPDRALADYEELHWGRMVSNGVRVLDLDDVLEAKAGRRLDGWLDEQGGIGGATGDPGGVVTGPDGAVAMAFSGVGEVVVRSGGSVKRIVVGTRPESMLLEDDRLYVANRFDDSISVIDPARGAVLETIPLGPAPELTAIERGERLFFDARVSHDGWISCHSCHTDGHSAGFLVDTLGDGDYGAPKRIPSLLGTRGTGPWSWTGSAESLEQQVLASVTTTMHGDALTQRQTADLVAFLESLEAPPPRGFGKRGLVDRGRALFEARGCADCHTPPKFTSDTTYRVDLSDERERRTFNPPSLRGVSHRERLFHDGRAEGLEDVLLRFRHQLDGPLAEEELRALLAFLRSL